MIAIDGTNVRGIFYGSAAVQAVYVGARLVWQAWNPRRVSVPIVSFPNVTPIQVRVDWDSATGDKDLVVFQVTGYGILHSFTPTVPVTCSHRVARTTDGEDFVTVPAGTVIGAGWEVSLLNYPTLEFYADAGDQVVFTEVKP